MNAREVAKLLGLHPNTVYNMIRDGEITANKVGRSYDIPDSEVKQLQHAKGMESLAKAQEQASMQLIVNLESEIEFELFNIQFNADMLSKFSGEVIPLDDYS